MKTYYISRAATPKKQTVIRARNPIGARAAFMRALGYPCRVSPKTGIPIFEGDEAKQDVATSIFNTLRVEVPVRTGRNPPTELLK